MIVTSFLLAGWMAQYIWEDSLVYHNVGLSLPICFLRAGFMGLYHRDTHCSLQMGGLLHLMETKYAYLMITVFNTMQ